MRAMSTETMQNIISYVDQYFCDKHTTPSVNEIALGVGIPKTTAFRYLVEMDNRGMLEYDGKSRTIRTPMIKKFAPDSAPCPLVGSIPCGSAQTEEENIREYVSLPVSLLASTIFWRLPVIPWLMRASIAEIWSLSGQIAMLRLVISLLPLPATAKAH